MAVLRGRRGHGHGDRCHDEVPQHDLCLEKELNKGPFTCDVRKILGIFDPLPLCRSTYQNSSLLFGYPLPQLNADVI